MQQSFLKALLCAAGVGVTATMLSHDRETWTTGLVLTLFIAAGWAFFAHALPAKQNTVRDAPEQLAHVG